MCDVTNFCLELIDDTVFGVAIETVLLAYSFVGIAIVADSYLATALEALCESWSIPEDVAGASFLALGSAAPEIVINAVSTIKVAATGQEAVSAAATSLGIGSIIGSGMMAFTLIPGLCGVVVTAPMQLTRRPVARDTLFYLVSLLVLMLAMRDGSITIWESVGMVALYAVYLGIVCFSPVVRRRWKAAHPPINASSDLTEKLAPPSEEDAPDRETSAAVEAEEEAGGEDPPAATGARRCISRTASALFAPVRLAIECSIPDCEGERAGGFVSTLLLSFGWLTVLSAVLSAVITRWGEVRP
jgi:Ca2+/Na+ antiporter